MAIKKKVAEPAVEPAVPAKAAKPKAAKPAKVEVLDPLNSFDAKGAREALGLNQSQFWKQVFVTQSGGSRYENERNVPTPVRALLVVAYGTDEQAQAMFDRLRSARQEVKA